MPARILAIAALTAVLMPPGRAAAQERLGAIDVVVREDARGAPLRGVTVKTFGTDEMTATTDAAGEAHFLGLAPGDYTVVATLRGYNDYHSINVPVATGTTVPLRLWMSVESPIRQVDTRIDAPVVDTRAQTVSTAVSEDELQRVPWTRDPWTVLQTVPTVIVDRVNVGGAESGQQLTFQAKGASPSDNTWTLEGIPITSLSAPGTSPTYFDFGMLRELRATTGGASPYIATPGVQVNVVLESGGNEWRASGRSYFGHHRLQSKNVSQSMRSELNSYSRAGNYEDFGAEGGGPILKGRLFGWAGAGRTEPERRIFASGVTEALDLETARDTTTLQNAAAKVNAVVDRNTRAAIAFLRNHKEERGYGASATRPLSAVFDEDATASFYKVSLDRRIGRGAFVSGRYAHVADGLSLSSRVEPVIYSLDRPQDYAAADLHLFRRAHQLTFGLSWRHGRVRQSITPPIDDFTPLPIGDYWSAYASDTIALPRVTIELATKWERARSAAGAREIVWNSVTPRVGVSYVVDREETTVIRGSYAILPSQLPAATASPHVIPGDAPVLSVLWTPVSIGNYTTPRTQEIVIGGDRYLSSGVTMSALLTWRRMSHFNWTHFRNITGRDFVPIGHVTGEERVVGSFDVPLFAFSRDAIANGFEPLYERRDGYHQRYWGIEMAAAKRFSNNWALRLAFSTNDHREYFAGPDAMAQLTPTVDSPNTNGGKVIRRVDAPGAGEIFMIAPRYQFAGTASYQLPLGMDTSVAYTLRQGYATPFYTSSFVFPEDRLFAFPGDALLVRDLDRARLPMAHTLDGRLSKDFATTGARVYSLHIDLDVFNVFNRAIVLARGYDLARADFNRILGITNPRTFRLGVRVSF